MAVAPAYASAGLKLGLTAYPIDPDSLQLNGGLITDDIMTANDLELSTRLTVGKRPTIEADCLDPSAVSAFGTVVTPQAFWRQREKDGALSATYLSFLFANGVQMPISLQADERRRAALRVRVLGVFVAGVAGVVGAAAQAAVAITKAYYPKHIVVGADTIVQCKSLGVNWDWEIDDYGVLEPAYYSYVKKTMTGQATVRDLAKVITVARLEDGLVETTLDVVFEDRSATPAADVTVSLGNAWVTAEVQGNDGTINFESVVSAA